MSQRLEELRQDLINGKGFFRFRGLPVQKWDLQKCATAYMGLGTYLGYFVSQNGRGHVLGHVKDLGEDPTKTDRVRIYRTNARYVIILIKVTSGSTLTFSLVNTSIRMGPILLGSFASPNRCLAESLTLYPRTMYSMYYKTEIPM